VEDAALNFYDLLILAVKNGAKKRESDEGELFAEKIPQQKNLKGAQPEKIKQRDRVGKTDHASKEMDLEKMNLHITGATGSCNDFFLKVPT